MNHTFTTKGCIPHLRVVTAHGVIFAPVMLGTEPSPRGGRRVLIEGGLSYGLPVPMEFKGEFLYALPGGVASTAADLHRHLEEAA